MKKMIIIFLLFNLLIFMLTNNVSAYDKNDSYTTNELLEKVINSTIFQKIKFFSDDYTAINTLVDNFDLGCELISRKDADSILYDKYISLYKGPYEKNVDVEIYKIELLLRIPELCDNLSKLQIELFNNYSNPYVSSDISLRTTDSNIIYTPNGTPVKYVTTFDCILTEEEKAEHHDEVKNLYNLTDDDLIYDATLKFNCHSYAWYSQNLANSIWLNHPDSYINDYSYEETDLAQENYILCYIARGIHYKDSVIIPEYGEYVSHSALITNVGLGFDINDISSLSELEVKSKWGDYGLYNHTADNCPYVEEQYDFVRVEIYRPRFHISTTFDSDFSTSSFERVINSENFLDSYFLLEINSKTSRYYDFEINSVNPISIKFYDANMHQLNVLPVEMAGVNKKYMELIYAGLCYIRVEFENPSLSGNVFVNVDIHSSHKYVYEAINNKYHILTCPCGVTSGDKTLHIADVYGSNGLTTTCKECGCFLPSSGSEIYPGLMSIGRAGN